jgi:pyruvate formate-lyase activating enzyme-like uncharacterized protein
MKPTRRDLALSSFLGFLSHLQVTETHAAEANRLRDGLLAHLQARGVRYSAKQSKLYTGELSPGCATCGAGTWSCAYLTKQCTAACFFCPSEPGSDGSLPRANRLPLPNLEAYIALLRFFQFRGVAFSGGEPLLAFEDLVTWITRIKQEFGDGIYLWVYTNGDLVDEDKLQALHHAGLDEIRINIRARDYRLAPVILARKFIQTVTVEIPTIPEDNEILKDRIVDLHKLGVDHLNLHQLFANQVNYRSLAERSYTFLPLVGTASPVLESEITALRLLLFALENQIDLPINYCSLVYRTRYDELAHRRRAAALSKQAHDTVAETGLLRRLSTSGPPESIWQIHASLEADGYDSALWRVKDDGTSLIFHPTLLASSQLQRKMVNLEYYVAELHKGGAASTDQSGSSMQVHIGPDLDLCVEERLASTPVTLPGAELAACLASRVALERLDAGTPSPNPCPDPLRSAEQMPHGLQEIVETGSLLETVAE